MYVFIYIILKKGVITIQNMYDVLIEEAVLNSANPYQIRVQIVFSDGLFEEYIREVCHNKQVCLYEMRDTVLDFFRRPSFVVRLDRYAILQKKYKGYFNPNMVSPVDLTEPFIYGFEKSNARKRFKKQFSQQLEEFLTKEAKNFLSFQRKQPALSQNTTINQARKPSNDEIMYDVEIKDGKALPIVYQKNK